MNILQMKNPDLLNVLEDNICNFCFRSLILDLRSGDAYPGRLNQFSVLINRLGTFYGQCSEICGILHSSMPIVVESVPLEKFLSWLQEQ